jgi:hypothetical protein
MNSVTILALVVLFPPACLLALLALSWLEDSLERGIEADANRAAAVPATSPVVEMAVRRTAPATDAPAPLRRPQPARAAS